MNIRRYLPEPVAPIIVFLASFAALTIIGIAFGKTNSPPTVKATNAPIILPDPTLTNNPSLFSPAALKDLADQNFAMGVEFGIMTTLRNPDVKDVRILAQIAWRLRNESQAARTNRVNP